MREYYLVAGNADEMNRFHSLLFRPEELRIEQNHLIFMEENQAVVHWGIPVSEVGDPNPIVWQRLNGETPEWMAFGGASFQ